MKLMDWFWPMECRVYLALPKPAQFTERGLKVVATSKKS